MNKFIYAPTELPGATHHRGHPGIRRDVVIPTTCLGLARDPWGHDRIGFEAELTLNRKDFGLNWNATLETGGLLVGDNVHISLSIQAVGQPSTNGSV